VSEQDFATFPVCFGDSLPSKEYLALVLQNGTGVVPNGKCGSVSSQEESCEDESASGEESSEEDSSCDGETQVCATDVVSLLSSFYVQSRKGTYRKICDTQNEI